MVYTEALRAFVRKDMGVRVPPAAHFTVHSSQRVHCELFSVNIMKYFVYIVECSGGMFYTGITWNLEERIKEHNSGTNTPIQKSRLPVRLIFWEKFDTRINAAKREKEIKGWRREKKIQLINSLR